MRWYFIQFGHSLGHGVRDGITQLDNWHWVWFGHANTVVQGMVYDMDWGLSGDGGRYLIGHSSGGCSRYGLAILQLRDGIGYDLGPV